jgi:hypothetical protein
VQKSRVSAATVHNGVQTITILALLYLGLQSYPAYRSSDVYLKIRVPFQGRMAWTMWALSRFWTLLASHVGMLSYNEIDGFFHSMESAERIALHCAKEGYVRYKVWSVIGRGIGRSLTLI